MTVCVWETLPPVAVTVTLYVPDVDELQDSVAVVEDGSVMLVGVIVQERPAGGESVRLIVPVKPFSPARLMVEVAEDPVLTADGEDAVRVKSGDVLEVTVKATEAVWTNMTLVALTVTV